MKPLDRLKALAIEENKRKYPEFPDSYRPVKKYKTTTANGCTSAICDFLNFSGHFASRINNTGLWVKEKAHVNGGYYRPSTQAKGIADISANINKNGIAHAVWIEIKIGKDRMSTAQHEFKEKVERAGAQYWIVKTFDDFYEKYMQFIES
jgi:hypothetical protein